jgi:hypothetical protein
LACHHKRQTPPSQTNARSSARVVTHSQDELPRFLHVRVLLFDLAAAGFTLSATTFSVSCDNMRVFLLTRRALPVNVCTCDGSQIV